MDIIRTSGRRIALLASLVTALLTIAGTVPALAAQVPGSVAGEVLTPASPSFVPVYVGGGMPGWQITLIAVGAALTAAVLAVLADRARRARQPRPVRPASDASTRPV